MPTMKNPGAHSLVSSHVCQVVWSKSAFNDTQRTQNILFFFINNIVLFARDLRPDRNDRWINTKKKHSLGCPGLTRPMPTALHRQTFTDWTLLADFPFSARLVSFIIFFLCILQQTQVLGYYDTICFQSQRVMNIFHLIQTVLYAAHIPSAGICLAL